MRDGIWNVYSEEGDSVRCNSTSHQSMSCDISVCDPQSRRTKRTNTSIFNQAYHLPAIRLVFIQSANLNFKMWNKSGRLSDGRAPLLIITTWPVIQGYMEVFQTCYNQWVFIIFAITSIALQLITFSVNHKFSQLRKTWDVKTIDNDFLMLVLDFTHQDKKRLKGVCQNFSNHNNDRS